MGASQRRKGADAERELRNMLAEHLGEGVIRELGASRDGGHDITGCGPFALEAKRRERIEYAAWWAQACRQARESGLVPALAYRQSRRPWVFVVPMGVVFGNNAPWEEQPQISMGIDGFALAVREFEATQERRRQVKAQLEAS